ncbi:MAG: MaoC family dehydratase [Dehalococcoidia bacterium]|nr:MaoC family dehydratase [Dehalococcoidia bacterium]
MAAPARALLADLPKGHQFPATTFELKTDDVSRYLEAVEDTNAVYRNVGIAPPLAVAARALGALLDLIELPAGTLHTGQEVEARAPVPFDATLTLAGRIAQRAERAGVIISVIEFEVTPNGSGAPALRGRTTVVVQATESGGGSA